MSEKKHYLVFSEDLKRYYKSSMMIILESLRDGEPQYTHYFSFIPELEAHHLDRQKIKQCLRTLESDGFVQNINLGLNIHQWKITESGIEYLKNKLN